MWCWRTESPRPSRLMPSTSSLSQHDPQAPSVDVVRRVRTSLEADRHDAVRRRRLDRLRASITALRRSRQTCDRHAGSCRADLNSSRLARGALALFTPWSTWPMINSSPAIVGPRSAERPSRITRADEGGPGTTPSTPRYRLGESAGTVLCGR